VSGTVSVRAVGRDEWVVRGIDVRHVVVIGASITFKDALFNDTRASVCILSLTSVAHLIGMPDGFPYLAAVNVGHCLDRVGVAAVEHTPLPGNPEHAEIVLGPGRNKKARQLLAAAVKVPVIGSAEEVYAVITAAMAAV
jgi:hypothetical protein